MSCWCGNRDLEPFSEDYQHCPVCESLVWVGKICMTASAVMSSEEGYYGRDYWHGHQIESLGLPDINVRARTDLTERFLYWLQTLMKYRWPPAQVIELGSGHGGYVALLQRTGYQAKGLELSPWVVDFAHKAFGVSLLLGPIEKQEIEPGSLDIIVLMDVLEHLVDPFETMRHCLKLLKPDGMFMIQTPCYPEGKLMTDLVAEDNSFIRMLIPVEHVHLFSQKAIRHILERLKVKSIVFEPAFFPEHDMFLFAGLGSLQPISSETIENLLTSSPDGRFVLALLDQNKELLELKQNVNTIEADRAARLDQINSLTERVHEYHKILERQQRIIDWLPHNIVRRCGRWFSSIFRMS